MKNNSKNKDYIEFPLKKFVKKYPLFSVVLYRTYPKSLVDESLQSDDYFVRYNGFMLEVGRKSDKWQLK